jgi:16S rRNA (adenine1518-N6/adenine1519-N6)-dimethyltransferase
LNNRYSIDYLFTVPPTAFDPPPKVDSAVVALHRREAPVFSEAQYEKMLVVLDTISGYKRKTLGKVQKICHKN